MQTPSREEKIVCSAILMDDGYIVRGHRHHNCIQTARDIPKYKEFKNSLKMQGFVTSENRFVGREEAYQIFVDGGFKSIDEKHPMESRNELYSEDLY